MLLRRRLYLLLPLAFACALPIEATGATLYYQTNGQSTWITGWDGNTDGIIADSTGNTTQTYWTDCSDLLPSGQCQGGDLNRPTATLPVCYEVPNRPPVTYDLVNCAVNGVQGVQVPYISLGVSPGHGLRARILFRRCNGSTGFCSVAGYAFPRGMVQGGGGTAPGGGCTATKMGDIAFTALRDDELNGKTASAQINLECRQTANVTLTFASLSGFGATTFRDNLNGVYEVGGGWPGVTGFRYSVQGGIPAMASVRIRLTAPGGVPAGPFRGAGVVTMSYE